MKAVKFLVVLCAITLLTNMSAAQNTEEAQPSTKKTISLENDNLVPANRRTNERYRIGFQDTLEIIVFKHEDLTLRAVNVSPEGTIVLPRLENVPIMAVCKTERELADAITALYRTVLKNPFVSVRAIDQRSQPFSVIGAVEKPGSFNLNRKIRLLELLAFAGGPDVEKAGANIQVARVGNVSGCVETADSQQGEVTFFRYKIKDVMDGKENPWMQPGDVVSVSDIEYAFVVGNVKEAAKVPLKEPVTLTQAIAFAGGLAPEAKTSKVRIQRQKSGDTEKIETVYDLKDILSRKIPDPILQANDIVDVPKDGVKSIRNGLIKVFTGGIPTLIRGY